MLGILVVLHPGNPVDYSKIVLLCYLVGVLKGSSQIPSNLWWCMVVPQKGRTGLLALHVSPKRSKKGHFFGATSSKPGPVVSSIASGENR